MDFALTSAPHKPLLQSIFPFSRLRSARPSSRRAFDEGQRRFYLSQYGSHTSSYFHQQPGVDYFDMPGIGFLSFLSQQDLLGRQDLVFASPVCAEENLPLLIDAFLMERGGHPVFTGVDPACARVLEKRGYSVNQIGVEFNIPIQTFKVAGKAMKYLRSVQHFGERGVEVRELAWSEVDPSEVARISSAWLAQKQVKGREIKLMSRPPEWRDAWGVRKFYCFLDGKMVGYVFFDPFFRDGRVVGYCANILRAQPDLPLKGILDFALLEALKVFRSEGAETLALGLAPCYDVQTQLNDRSTIRHILQLMYRRGGFLYSFQELAFHKTRWRAEEQRIYACLRGRSGVSDVRAALSAIRSMNVL
jgi:lysylphosphatidylglycerol synthetase-like protein (DUF2156 family)